jgi:Palmitoyl protein thioesterase
MNLSAWLADINNERPEKNDSYKYHLSSLEKFVMIKFTEEKTVVPPDSSVRPPLTQHETPSLGRQADFSSGLESLIPRVGNIRRCKNGHCIKRIGWD